MNKAKKLLKQYLPKDLIKTLLPLYHLTWAVLANLIYRFPSREMTVVAITGTNGKTTTGALLANIFEAEGYKVGLSGTAFFKIDQEIIINDLNMTVTDPFKLQKMLRKMSNVGVDIVILEVTSHALVQQRVWGIKPTLALMTNLTQDHLDYHGTMEKYAEAKGKLFAMKPSLIALNQDDDWFDFYDKYLASDRKVSYGTSLESDIRLKKANLKSGITEMTVKIGDAEELFDTRLAGKFNAYNAMAAITAAHLMEVSVQSIRTGLRATTHVPGRMEAVDLGQDFDVFIDYAHTPDALKNVLETLDTITKGRVIVVFGATGDRDTTKRPIMGRVVSELSNIAIVTDDEPYTEDPAAIREEVVAGVHRSDYECELHNIGDRRRAIKLAVDKAQAGDVILVTGIGHQSYRVVGDQKKPWSEREVIEAAIQYKRN